MNITDELRSRLNQARFPLSSKYGAEWGLESWVGPNVLWLTEWATEVLPLEPSMRVLDLGCGKAYSSIFLAKEFGVTVWAADLWIDPEQNHKWTVEAGLSDRVLPLRAEAHELPFAKGYFHAIVSIDAYHYFGTDDLYLGYVSRFLRPGGHLCIVVPASWRNCPMGRQSGCGPIGNRTSAHSTAPAGGGGIGRNPDSPGPWPRTSWMAAGGTGLSGMNAM